MSAVVQIKDKQTPGGKSVALPTQALAAAIAKEWEGQKKFTAEKMPLTMLAFTAIDRISGKEADIIEVLLAYVDTDTLCYRASGSEELAKQQREQWGAVLDWAKGVFGVTWEVGEGIMPLAQPPGLSKAIAAYLREQDAMRLAAACVLASGYSSLALALAVMQKHLNVEQAFMLSRLEEEAQAEKWGRDPEAERRTARLKAEMLSAGEFLRLLNAP